VADTRAYALALSGSARSPQPLRGSWRYSSTPFDGNEYAYDAAPRSTSTAGKRTGRGPPARRAANRIVRAASVGNGSSPSVPSVMAATRIGSPDADSSIDTTGSAGCGFSQTNR
jgi:hypothetical protein